MAVLKNKIELKNVSKVYETRDKQVEVLNNLSFEVHENEFLVLLGPGRCGKTVLLNILANLEKQTSGTIEFAGGRPKMGDLGMVFQKYALFPWKTVMGNVEMSQKLKGVDKKVRQEKAQEYINLVGLKGFENSLPKQLSGGMKRKLMVCRALLTSPEILLLDEPTAGMDALSRRQMWNLLRQLNGKNLTILLTTHYMEEAQSLCNRVALMDHGKLEEINTPSGLIDGLGKYTVDQETPEGAKSHYFHSREEAISFLSSLDGQCTLRETTLEDVFVERAGRHLMQR